MVENILFDNIMMDKIYQRPINICIGKNEAVLCKAINNIRFSNLHVVGLEYPRFEGRESNPLGDIYFYNCSFTVKDEIDGRESTHTDMVQVYADKVHFINTEFKHLQEN